MLRVVLEQQPTAATFPNLNPALLAQVDRAGRTDGKGVGHCVMGLLAYWVPNQHLVSQNSSRHIDIRPRAIWPLLQVDWA